MLLSCPLIKGIERKFPYERDTVYQYIVALCTKLHTLCSFTPYYRTDVWFADTYNHIRNALSRISTRLEAIMLAIDFGYNLQYIFLLVYQQPDIRMDSHLMADIAQDFAY